MLYSKTILGLTTSSGPTTAAARRSSSPAIAAALLPSIPNLLPAATSINIVLRQNNSAQTYLSSTFNLGTGYTSLTLFSTPMSAQPLPNRIKNIPNVYNVIHLPAPMAASLMIMISSPPSHILSKHR
ncbi:MAG: hypothetical protein H6Q69_2554 [Firmicutes bacterium]|nr:hypothetical protein [Bacillota bacterium]